MKRYNRIENKLDELLDKMDGGCCKIIKIGDGAMPSLH